MDRVIIIVNKSYYALTTAIMLAAALIFEKFDYNLFALLLLFIAAILLLGGMLLRDKSKDIRQQNSLNDHKRYTHIGKDGNVYINEEDIQEIIDYLYQIEEER